MSEVNPQEAQQGLAAELIQTRSQPENANPTVPPVVDDRAISSGPSASTPTSQTKPLLSNTTAANHEPGEAFISSAETQRTVQPSAAGVPVRIMIPAIGLDAPVVEAKSRKILLQGDVFDQWIAPNQFATGWDVTSALVGEPGNTVLSGHHNDFGEVFGRLIDLNVGDTILLFSGSTSLSYTVVNKMILEELNVPVSQRIQNARWIGRSNDERLTLVTCWPKDTNTHRLIIVASPN